MNKAKLIKQIVGSEAEKLGFSYKGAENGDYIFYKEEGELKQYIFVGIVHGNYLDLELKSNAYGQKAVSVKGSALVGDNEEGMHPVLKWWEWESEEDFVRILELFGRLIAEKGAEKLQEISVPSENEPTAEMEKVLYGNYAELDRQYREKLGIAADMDSRTTAGIIGTAILSTKNMAIKEAEPDLIGIAAVVGTEIVNRCGGEWSWVEGLAKLCLIENMGGNKYKSESPLGIVFWYRAMGKDNVDGLLKRMGRTREL